MTINTIDSTTRRALLVGITYEDLQTKLSETYPNENFRLPGTHKDPLRIKKLLIDLFNYKEEDITILMDDNSGNYKKPTRDNMVAHMKSLVENVKPGDHLVFCFSGHGSQIVNTNNTEEDGFDEVIWPCDVSYDPSKENEHERAENFIQDDDLKKILVDNLPDNARLTVVLDNCHSGTGLDLPFHRVGDNPDKKWSTSSSDQKDNSLVMPSHLASKDSHKGARTRRRTSTMGMKMPHKTQGYHKKGSASSEEGTQFVEEPIEIHSTVPKSNAYVTSWAACMDDQLGIDSDQGGSLTLALDKILRKSPKMTNGDMLKALSKELFKQREEAEEYFRVNNIPTGNDSPQPKPSLGSLWPIEDIIRHKFTF